MVALGLSDEQLATRRKGLGGSDIAAVLGVDPYRTPFDVWLDKTGRAQPFAGNEHTRWGQRLEAAIADAYAERVGCVRIDHASTVVHPRHAFVLGTPDRLVFDSPFAAPPIYGVEVKNKGPRVAWRWGDEVDGAAGVPDEVQCQAHWYMALTELPRWDVVAYFGGPDLRVYRLERDLEIEGALLEAAARFWRDHVEADSAPAYDGGDAAWGYLRERLAGADKRVAEPTPEVEDLAAELEKTIHQLDDAKERKEVLRQKLTDLCAGLGVRGFASESWRFSIVEQRGRVNWKTVAEVLLAEAGATAARRAQLEEGSRGRPFVAPRFTSKKLKEEGE